MWQNVKIIKELLKCSFLLFALYFLLDDVIGSQSFGISLRKDSRDVFWSQATWDRLNNQVSYIRFAEYAFSSIDISRKFFKAR